MGERSVFLARWLAWLFAGCLIVATLLFVGLINGAFATPPSFPDSADLPTRLLGSIDFSRALWPFDQGSSLIYTAGFGALLVLSGVLGSIAPANDARRTAMVTTLAGAGVLVMASQLIHVGAHQVAIDIPYCDCGFKIQESISQAWGLMLIDGAQSWLLNGGAILLAIGVAIAGALFGGSFMGAGWRLMSYVTGGVLLVAVVVTAMSVSIDAAQLLTAVAGGIFLPLWAIWLGFGMRLRAKAPLPGSSGGSPARL